MFSKFKWLLVIQLLLTDQVLCRVKPLTLGNSALPGTDTGKKNAKPDHPTLHGTLLQLLPKSLAAQKEDRVQSAKQLLSVLRAKLQTHIKEHLYVREDVNCGELLSASTVDDMLSSTFPQELLGLSLVPVMVVADCPHQAQALVLKLYDLLGVADTEELLLEVEGLIQKKLRAENAASSSERGQAEGRIEAVMFNIQQLVTAGEGMGRGMPEMEEQCKVWTRVNGTTLVGSAVEGATGGLEEAVNTCERLGVLCAGVTSSKSGSYQAVLKKGSRILPSDSAESECWIHQCSVENDVSFPAASGGRAKRSAQRSCINKSEERVYHVMEWIPAVSTLYNLGTAVYYASVNCSATAKERAILSAVDLGTDALMVATGGTAGVAGYALGAGVKTGMKAGVKYLLNSMRQEDDLLVNQVSWEEGVLTIE